MEAAYARRAPVEEPRRRANPLLIFLILVTLLAVVVIAAVVISQNTSGAVVHLERSWGNDASQAISKMQSLINQYTK